MMHSEPQAPAASRLVQEVHSAALEPPAQPDQERFEPGGSLRTRAARGTLINTAFTVGLGALGLLKSFILAGFVSRSDYGVWGVLMVTLGTVLWLKQVGVGDKYIQQEDLDQELAFQKAFTLELALSGGLVVVMAVAVPAIVLAYGLPQLIAPSIVIAATLLISAFQAPLWVYYRRMQFARQRALAAVDPVVGFIVSVVMAAAGFGYWSFVGGLAAGVCAAAAVAVIQSPFKLRLRYTPGTFKTYTDFSVPLLVASAATLVMTWSAMIAAKLSLGVAALGVVALAATISSFTDSVDQLVTGSLYPAICAVRDKTMLLYESLVKSNRLALMWAVPFGVGITIFSPDLVRFGIGQRWHPAVVVLQVYGITAAINHVGFNWTAYFRARGQTRPIAVVNLASMAAFLTVGIPLLLAFGLPGFAAGVALQALVAVALRAYYLQQIFPGFDFLRHAARSFLPTMPAAAAVLLVRAVAPGKLGLSLGELGLYLIVTAGATWILESGLLREALSYVRGSRALPAVP